MRYSSLASEQCPRYLNTVNIEFPCFYICHDNLATEMIQFYPTSSDVSFNVNG